MRSKIALATVALAAITLVGAGCGSAAQPQAAAPAAAPEKQLAVVDPALKLFADIPAGWGSSKYNTLYKNAKEASGFSYVDGAINWGFGPKDANGEVSTKMHVIAVPKNMVATYDAAKDPENAVKMFDAGDYTVYTSTDAPTDAGVAQMISTLVRK